MRVLASELREHEHEIVVVAGWLHRRRQHRNMTFAVLRDRTGLTQVLTRDRDVMDQLADLPEETVIEVTGRVTPNEQAPGGLEITEPTIRQLSEAAELSPVEIYKPTVAASLPVILDNAPIALRHPRLRAPFEIAAASVAGFRSTLDGLGFTEIFTPKIVASATESGANVFALDYFGRPAFLAQSPQFYKQMMVGVFERVYETGPVFRAEPHDTARHIAEYVSLDAELGFIQDHRDVMAVLREALAGMTAAVREHAARALDLLEVTLPQVPEQIPALHFAEAQEMLAQGTNDDPRGDPDLAPAHERWLSAWVAEEHRSDFLFITGYPAAKRPFYTHPDPQRPGSTNGFDLLFRGQELVTGGQRLHRYSDYVSALRARGEDPADYSTYLAAFAHGMPPHGGFAIGLERWVARLVGADNIRAVTLFPRDLHRITP
jgi:nondiscriminating aspartyl-tRNA synthetase